MDFRDLVAQNSVLGQNRGRGGALLAPTNSFLILGIVTSVPILGRISIKKCDCESAHRQTNTRSDRRNKLNIQSVPCCVL